jgi:hypothetical protein
MILIAGYGGLRVGELAGLKVGHVNELTRRIAAISGGVMNRISSCSSLGKATSVHGLVRISPPLFAAPMMLLSSA